MNLLRRPRPRSNALVFGTAVEHSKPVPVIQEQRNNSMGHQQKITLADLHQAQRLGDLDGESNIALCMSYIRKFTPGGERLSHEEVFSRGRALKHQLEAGESVSTAPTGLPDLSAFPGATDLEKAVAYLEATLPDFDRLSDKEKQAAAQQLLARIEAEGADASDDTDDDPQLSAREQAIRNLDARTPAFRGLTHEQRVFGDQTRAETARVQRLRDARTAGDEPTLLTDQTTRTLASSSKPSASAIPERDLPSLAELRMHPGAQGVQSDLARMVTWLTQHQPSYAAHRWETQLSLAAPVLRAVLNRGGV